jgi:hypothetical protein
VGSASLPRPLSSGVVVARVLVSSATDAMVDSVCQRALLGAADATPLTDESKNKETSAPLPSGREQHAQCVCPSQDAPWTWRCGELT